MSTLKPFVINQTDIQFILDQVNFLPLFDVSGKIIVNWDGTGRAYDFSNRLLATGGTVAGDAASLAALALVGASYQNFTDLAGTRDVSGFWNNLTPFLAHYGDTGQIFPRMAGADYGNYLQEAVTLPAGFAAPIAADLAAVQGVTKTEVKFADSVHFPSHVDITYFVGDVTHTLSVSYETFLRTTTASETTSKFIDGHHVFVNQQQDSVVTGIKTDVMLKDGTGEHVDTAGAFVYGAAQTTVSTSGGELDGRYHTFSRTVSGPAAQTAYALSHQDYSVSKDATAAATEGDTLATDGSAINIKNVVDYTPRMISRTTTTAGVTYDTWANHQADAAHVNHTASEIYYGPTGEATVLNWGQLETVANGGLGQVDTQARLAASAGQDDHFIGGLNPGVSPSNGFFVLFGQFFDHGLDFVDKGQLDASGKNLTIKIALAVDDPLYGMLGPDGQPVHEITINRATVQTVTTSVDVNGNTVESSQYVNHVSPFIDQSQTYGSSAQRTQLLREWVSTDGGSTYHAGMTLLDGTTLATPWAKADGTLTHDTLPTLNELRSAIDATNRDALTWDDIGNLRNRDSAGHVIAGSSGEALLLDMNPRFDTAHLLHAQGENAAETAKVFAAITTLNTFGIRPGDTFGFNADGLLTLHLGSDLSMGPGQPAIPAGTDLTGASALAGWVDFSNFSIMQTPPGIPSQFVSNVRAAVSDILLASVGDHYIAGDGRVNENFGLTSIHHVFHEEHNFQVQNLIDALHRQDIATNDTTHEKLHEFQVNTGHTNAVGDYIYADNSIAWNEDKVFQGAKLIVEMEYQHAAVDQYARNVSPNIQEFVGYSPNKDPDVTLEYSQVAFRFGHSTLRETIDTIDPTHGITGKIMGYALHDAFLNPDMYGAIGPASILLGMTHQQQNEVDEFVTPALNQGLLGQPLDLAAINIARGRDIGIPTLNDFREAVGLVRYTSWNDFGQNMQHPSSLVNFIAAYSFDGDVAKAQAIIDLASGAISSNIYGFTASQAVAFMSGDATHGGAGTLGFNQIDTWLGGLAEVHQPGGLLGETFDLVFVTQIESLMDGDRFYYLYRLAGQQFGEEVANAQLKDIVERNSGLTHLNGNIFGYADQYVDLGATKEVMTSGEAQTTGNDHKHGDEIAAYEAAHPGHTIGIYSNGGAGNTNDGAEITIGGTTYIQDTRLSADNPMSADYDATGHSAYAQNGFVNLDGTPNSGAESSEVIVGSKGDDLIYAQGGDDTVYGEGGDDTIYGGFGIDRLYGGDGNDHIYGGDNPDLIDGGSGNDWLYGESSGSDINGSDQIVGGSGNDHIYGGTGIDKLSAGSGDDMVYGGQDTDPFTHGGDGNDYVDGGSGGDILYGDNGDDVVVGGADQDQLFGNDGDDILRPGDPTGALTIGGDEVLGGDGSDVNDKGFDLIDFSDNNVRPGGVTFDLSNQQNPSTTPNGSSVQVQSFQIDGIIGSKGDDTLIGDDATAAGAGSDATIAGNNWLIGGSGNDAITGGGGNDIIIGGSIRLDALIGKYNSAYTHNMNNAGITSADQLLDAQYQGASNRVLYSETIDNSGLLGHAETNMFEKHFTEMLRTEMFKDMVLGDGGTDGTADTAVYSGKLESYTLVALDAQGGVVAFPHRDGFFALKIIDNRTAADLIDSNGNPIVDAYGNPIALDGTDLVIGVENIRFADQTINPAAYFDVAPTLDLNYAPGPRNTLDAFGSSNNAYGQNGGSVNWNGSWQETNDGGGNNGGSGSGQITRNSSGVLQFGTGDGAEISRGVGQDGAAPTSIVFDLQAKNGIGAGETLSLQYSSDGTHFVTLATYGSADALGTKTISLSDQTMTANSEIRFSVSALGGTGNNPDYFRVDNIRVNFVGDTAVGSNNTASYMERSATGASVTTAPHVADTDDINLASARIVLTDAIAGDELNVGNLSGLGITATGNGSGTGGLVGATIINLSGAASAVAYESALKTITYTNPTNHNPTVYNTNTSRHIDVTVNDGLKDSALATTTVTITAINDPTVAGNDTIITNAGNASFVVPDAAFLANDLDPDTILTISGVTNTSGLTASHQTSTTTVADTNGAAASSFHYNVNGMNPTVNVVQQSGTTLTGTTNGEILVGGATNDTINAGDGNDFIVWNAAGTVTRNNNGSYTTNVSTGGHDIVNGGAGTDTFILNSTVTGVGQGTQLANARPEVSETFNVYSNTDDWDKNAANGIQSSAAHFGISSAAEIVVTRNGAIVAELNGIEEIVINTGPGNDTVAAIGDFTGTSLHYSTITINDADGGDTVDISGLTSEHRIVFNTDTNGHVIGDLRPQDVVNTAATTPSTPGDTTVPPPDGSTDPSGNDGGIAGNGPGPGELEHAGSHDHDGHHHGGTYDHANDSACDTAPSTDVPADAPVAQNGTAANDVLVGGSADDVFSGSGGDDLILGNDGADMLKGGGGDDLIKGGAGNDMLFGNDGDDDLFGGDGHDMMFGDAGNDRLFGDAGNDVIEAGSGNDVVYAGTGDDRILATVNDGDDTYWGEDGSDTLDYAAISANITVDLGNGAQQHGNVSSAQSGTDTIFGFENFIGGAGDDIIIASSAVNVMDGGAGNDTFVFHSAADANGDIIKGFQPGDTIDLSGIDANSTTSGNQSFVLFAGTNFTAAGQVMISHETLDGVDHTFVIGNTNSDLAADFKIDLVGNHALTSTDFHGVN